MLNGKFLSYQILGPLFFRWLNVLINTGKIFKNSKSKINLSKFSKPALYVKLPVKFQFLPWNTQGNWNKKIEKKLEKFIDNKN